MNNSDKKWQGCPTKEYRYFLHDPEGHGLIYFKSTDDRDAEAKKAIKDYMSDYDGWSEDVELVCVGEVTHIVTKTNVIKRPPDDEIDEEGCDGEGNYWDADWSEMCNYELKKI